jgi:hypothetical protein
MRPDGDKSFAVKPADEWLVVTTIFRAEITRQVFKDDINTVFAKSIRWTEGSKSMAR